MLPLYSEKARPKVLSHGYNSRFRMWAIFSCIICTFLFLQFVSFEIMGFGVTRELNIENGDKKGDIHVQVADGADHDGKDFARLVKVPIVDHQLEGKVYTNEPRT